MHRDEHGALGEDADWAWEWDPAEETPTQPLDPGVTRPAGPPGRATAAAPWYSGWSQRICIGGTLALAGIVALVLLVVPFELPAIGGGDASGRPGGGAYPRDVVPTTQPTSRLATTSSSSTTNPSASTPTTAAARQGTITNVSPSAAPAPPAPEPSATTTPTTSQPGLLPDLLP